MLGSFWVASGRRSSQGHVDASHNLASSSVFILPHSHLASDCFLPQLMFHFFPHRLVSAHSFHSFMLLCDRLKVTMSERGGWYVECNFSLVFTIVWRDCFDYVFIFSAVTMVIS